MPLDKQVFRTRAITAIVFAAIVLAGILINGYTFLALLIIIGIGAYAELIRLLKKIYPNGYSGAAVAGIIYIFLPLVLLTDLSFPKLRVASGSGILFDGAWRYDFIVPLFIIGAIWINDTMAYVSGSFWGKRPLSKISPKKTIEGTIGGILFTVAIAFVVSYLLQKEEANWFYSLMFAGAALIIAVFGTIGDLFESKLKRMAGVKDSASFMPGHGGFLDRFDSLFFAVPAIWLLEQLF